MTRGPWPLYFLAEKGTWPPEKMSTLRPGACWFAPWLLQENRGLRVGDIEELSPDYLAKERALRPPLVVWMPGVAAFCIDCRATSSRTWWMNHTPIAPGEDPAAWVRRLTITASVDMGAYYHGHIQQGQITPDCRNLEYDERGYLVGKPEHYIPPTHLKP